MKKQTYKLILGIVISSIIHIQSRAEPLPPLNEYVASFQNDSPKPDPTEIAYFANRSAALLNLIGAYFTIHATEDSDKLNGEKITKMAEDFSKVGILFDKKLNKKSDESIVKQRKIFTDYYAEAMQHGKLSQNSVFSGPVGIDYKTALKYYPIFEGILESASNK